MIANNGWRHTGRICWGWITHLRRDAGGVDRCLRYHRTRSHAVGDLLGSLDCFLHHLGSPKLRTSLFLPEVERTVMNFGSAITLKWKSVRTVRTCLPGVWNGREAKTEKQELESTSYWAGSRAAWVDGFFGYHGNRGTEAGKRDWERCRVEA